MEETSKNEKIDENLRPSHEGLIKFSNKENPQTKRKMLILIAALQIKYPHHLTMEGKVKEMLMRNLPLGYRRVNKRNVNQPVISYEIKGKIHQWSFCREMSQNHLGDAMVVLLAYHFVTLQNVLQHAQRVTSDSPKCRHLAVCCLQRYCRGKAYV